MNFPQAYFPRTTIPEDSTIYKVFEKIGNIRYLKKNEMLHWQEDIPHQFYLVKSGQLRSFLISDNGRQITLEIVSKGRLFGLASYASGLPRPCSANAIIKTELYSMDYAALQPYLSTMPNIAMEFFHLLGDNIYFLIRQINNLSFFSAKKRIAYSLIHLGGYYKNNPQDKSYSLPFTHQDIADLDGVNRVTASRVLQEFEQLGLVRLQYGTIHIMDEDLLQKILFTE